MLGYMLIAIALVASTAHAQEGEVIVPENNKTQCIAQMVQWCNGMQYPQQGAGMNMLSISYKDPTGYFRVLCASDSDGTNCTRNGQHWFACSAENQLTYNGKVLKADGPTADVDNDICKTADRAFNDIFVQNLSYDNITLKTELEKSIESFFAEFVAMQEEIDLLQKKLERIPFFNDDNIWNGFGEGFLFQIDNATDTKGSITTDHPNQIERE